MKRLFLVLAVLAVLLGGALLWLANAPMDVAGTSNAPTSAAAPDGPAPAAAGDGDETDGAANSFIVCPGDPRCP